MDNQKVLSFRRKDDGEIFSINEDGTYSNDVLKKQFPGHLIIRFTFERLSDLKRHFEVHEIGANNGTSDFPQ